MKKIVILCCLPFFSYGMQPEISTLKAKFKTETKLTVCPWKISQYGNNRIAFSSGSQEFLVLNLETGNVKYHRNPKKKYAMEWKTYPITKIFFDKFRASIENENLVLSRDKQKTKFNIKEKRDDQVALIGYCKNILSVVYGSGYWIDDEESHDKGAHWIFTIRGYDVSKACAALEARPS